MENTLCTECAEQAKKSRNGKPHHALIKMGESRIFSGKKPRGYEQQDYQCLSCKAKFTHSTDKNDLSWTLWRS